MSWVTPDKFDASKISLQEQSSNDSYERGKILYEYSEGSTRDLTVTVPRLPDAYVTCRGVQKDFFSRGDSRIETNRYGAQFVLSGTNEYHTALYKTFADIKTKLEEATGGTVSFPVKDMDNYSILYTNLIHSNDGRMFSSAYTEDAQVDIKACGKCVVRPAFVFTTLRKSKTEIKIKVQVSQMYVHSEIKEFPLAHDD